MTIKHLFPVSKPTLDLNFAATLQLDPRITFSRSSIGTYTDANGIIRTAADDEARFDHNGDGKSLGLLIEESRTNTFLNSNDCTLWDSNRATHGTDTGVITAPDGSNSVGWFESSIGLKAAVVKGGTVIDGTVASSMFVWVKARSGSPWVAVGPGQPGSNKQNVFFNLSTGEQGQRGTALVGDVDIIPFPNGWYKIVFTGITPIALTNSLSVWSADYDGQVNEDQTILSSYYCWGAQVEDAAACPSSYIPTAGTVEDRDVDICSIEGSNFSSWYNQSEGTLMQSFVPKGDFTTYAGRLYLNRNNYTGTYISPANRIVHVYRSGGENVLLKTGTYVNTEVNVGMAYSSTGLSGCYNGTEVQTLNAISGTQLELNQLLIGEGTQHIARLSYYPRRLSDEQLQALTS